MIFENWEDNWPYYLFILACAGGILGFIMHYIFGVSDSSPWMYIPLLLVIPGPLIFIVLITLILLKSFGEIAAKILEKFTFFK